MRASLSYQLKLPTMPLAMLTAYKKCPPGMRRDLDEGILTLPALSAGPNIGNTGSVQENPPLDEGGAQMRAFPRY